MSFILRVIQSDCHLHSPLLLQLKKSAGNGLLIRKLA